MEPEMKRLILAVILIGCLALVSSAGAQAVLGFNIVQIQFWPEYDSPEMLIIYTLELPAEQALPVEISVRIPARAISPTAVAVLQGNQLVTREYTLSEEGDWVVVTLVTDSPVIHLEYYDPLLSQSDQTRDFLFEWSFDYPVDELVIAFKAPINAANLTFSSDLGAPETGADGLDLYSASVGELRAGEKFSFSIQYQKPDDRLSTELQAQALPQAELQPVEQAAQDQFPDWGWYLVGAGAVILAGGGMYLWYINTPIAFSKYRQKKARSSVVRAVFCHKCGARSNSGDKFCRECGTKLRK
jgi:hypothetical protein